MEELLIIQFREKISHACQCVLCTRLSLPYHIPDCLHIGSSPGLPSIFYAYNSIMTQNEFYSNTLSLYQLVCVCMYVCVTTRYRQM